MRSYVKFALMSRGIIPRIHWGRYMTKAITILKILVGIIIALPALGLLLQFAWSAVDDIRYPAPGEYVDIGGRDLHAIIMGEGPVTVLFDSGSLGGATQWKHVQPEVSRVAKTISYDRAGLGWSEGAERYTSEQIADDMFALFDALGQQEPVIMVGHSMGGKNIRTFLQKYPELVRGIVFVDHTSNVSLEETAERFPELKPMLPMIEKQYSDMIESIDSFLPKLYFGLHRFDESLYPLPMPEPPEDMYSRSVPQASVWKTMQGNLIHSDRSFEFLDGFRPLANVPITVITRGIMNDPLEAKIIEVTQKEMAASSSNSRHVTAEKSGHEVPDEQPEIIISSVLEIIELTVR